MKNLDTLIRNHQWKLDQKRRSLQDLETLIADLHKQSKDLESELIEETEFALKTPESSMTLENYTNDVQNRQKFIEETIDKLEKEVSLKKEEVLEAFRELKKFELTKEHIAKTKKKQKLKKEQKLLDEVSQQTQKQKNYLQ